MYCIYCTVAARPCFTNFKLNYLFGGPKKFQKQFLKESYLSGGGEFKKVLGPGVLSFLLNSQNVGLVFSALVYNESRSVNLNLNFFMFTESESLIFVVQS